MTDDRGDPGWTGGTNQGEPPPEVPTMVGPMVEGTERSGAEPEATVTGQDKAKTPPPKRSARAKRGAPSNKPALITQDGETLPIAEPQAEPPTKDRERYDKDPDGLTFKQRGFVIAMLKGATASDAYRGSYDTARMKPSSVHENASRLMRHVKIAARLDAGFRSQEEMALRSGASHRRLIEDRLVELAQCADTDAASLRALELLGKLDTVGAFRERIEIDQGADQAPEDLERALQARLADLFAKAG